MSEILFSVENLPFSIALALMATLVAIEVIGLLLGMGLSDILDGLMPDIDLDADIDHGSGLGIGIFNWLNIDKVPVIFAVMVFLTVFGLAGLSIQMLATSLAGTTLSGGVASILALIASVPILKFALRALGRILPSDETDAVSADSLVGLTGEIVIGVAEPGSPAQGKVTNELGQTHYLMVEPDDAKSTISTGDRFKLVGRVAGVYKAKRLLKP